MEDCSESSLPMVFGSAFSVKTKGCVVGLYTSQVKFAICHIYSIYTPHLSPRLTPACVARGPGRVVVCFLLLLTLWNIFAVERARSTQSVVHIASVSETSMCMCQYGPTREMMTFSEHSCSSVCTTFVLAIRSAILSSCVGLFKSSQLLPSGSAAAAAR